MILRAAAITGRDAAAAWRAARVVTSTSSASSLASAADPFAAAAAAPAPALATTTAADPLPIPDYLPSPMEPVTVVHKLGLDLLRDPLYNGGSAFSMAERERLGLRGLLPPRITTLQWQMERFLASFESGEKLVPPESLDGGVTNDMAVKWKRLQALQDRSEALFYRLLIERFAEMAPLVYTPTVGWACVNYAKMYRRPRGMFFSVDDKGCFASMALNWPCASVQAIVITDGSRILGLGDLGLNGMGICIGKLDLYVGAAGFNPAQVLPVVLDVGTDNERLLNDPLYMGVRRRRVKGRAYYELVDELIGALTRRWPKAVIQFEDFSIDVARPLLDRYRSHHTVFNDDIQGTACTALGGLYSAVHAQDLPREALARQRVVVVGAGSAGMGVVETVARGMARSGKVSMRVAAGRFWVLDKDGLITDQRADVPAHVAPFARRVAGAAATDGGPSDNDDNNADKDPADSDLTPDSEGESLLSVVRRVKPTVLLGLAGAGKLFTPDVLRALADGCASHAGRGGLTPRPVVFAMSNPTSRLECTSQEAHDHTGGRAIYASGSPQPPVVVRAAGAAFGADGGDGSSSSSSPPILEKRGQANNIYVFPGLALGASLARTRTVTDGMLMAAAEVLPDLVSREDLAAGLVFPPLSEIRRVSAAVAAAVMRAAHAEGLVTEPAALGALAQASDDKLRRWVGRRMWRPTTHTALAYLPPGIGE